MKGQHQKTVRALLGSVREYKKPSLLCPVFVVLEVLMEVLVPGVMALMIDKGDERRKYRLYSEDWSRAFSYVHDGSGIRYPGRDKCGQGLGRYGTEFEKGYVPPHTGVFFFQY